MTSVSPSSLAIAIPVANVYREPDATSEVVTQALLNTPAQVLETAGGWQRIRLSDYEGWVRSSELAEQTLTQDWLATVDVLRAPLYAAATGETLVGQAYATTTLPAAQPQARRVPVRLPGGAAGWLDATAVTLRPVDVPAADAGPEVALALARQLLGTPYLWGGVTMEGIDCSGLTQLCCRAAGVTIPRDADQQFEGIPYIVEHGDLRIGDLIYFASNGAITHTAIMLDAQRYIHAKGSPESLVMLNALESGATGYNEVLAGHYAGARRPFAPRARRILV